jgi:cell division protein FtsL
MTDIQLYFAIGVPVFAIVISMIASMMQVTTINARITSLESTIHSRFTSLETRFETGLTRLDERLEHL